MPLSQPRRYRQSRRSSDHWDWGVRSQSPNGVRMATLTVSPCARSSGWSGRPDTAMSRTPAAKARKPPVEPRLGMTSSLVSPRCSNAANRCGSISVAAPDPAHAQSLRGRRACAEQDGSEQSDGRYYAPRVHLIFLFLSEALRGATKPQHNRRALVANTHAHRADSDGEINKLESATVQSDHCGIRLHPCFNSSARRGSERLRRQFHHAAPRPTGCARDAPPSPAACAP